MKNEPRIEIQYLVDFELEFIPDLKNSLGESNLLSNPQNLNDDVAVNGFKGFHLSGGSKDSDGNDIGCILDGSYKFYDPIIKYNGLLGNQVSEKSDDVNIFTTPQKIDIETMYPNTYLQSLLIYFDRECNEYATKLRFNNSVETDKILINNKLLFMRSFGENSTLTSTNVEFLEWSKENSLVKISKIKTGFTGIYTPMQIRDLFYSNDKFSDQEELRFGVSLQTANIKLYDKDGAIMTLYEARLFFKNVRVLIYIDNVVEADLLLDTKSSNNTINYWEFDCKDILSYRLEEKLPIMGVQVDSGGVPIPKSLKYMIDYTLAGVSNPKIYDIGLEEELEGIMIPIAFIRPNQTRYDILLKIAQVGLLRIYTDKDANIIISRGL